MIRVNGLESAAVLTNMYPDAIIGRDVLYLHMDAPAHESSMWGTDNRLEIEADWRKEFGAVRYAPTPGLAAIMAQCSAQGQFLAQAENTSEDGRLRITLRSIGKLRPL